MSARKTASIASVQQLERRMLFALALDPGFGQGGILDNVLDPDPQGFSQNVSLIHLLDNGKVLVGGTAFAGGEPGMRVARYTAEGVPDPTFNGDGFSPLINGFQVGFPGSGAVQSDGKILLAAGKRDEIAVVRFNADGSIDTGFGGGDGLASSGGLGAEFDGVNATSLSIDSNGDIIVAGHEDIGSTAVVARFNSDGSPDTTYSGDGKDLITFGDIIPGTLGGLRTAGAAALAGGKILLLVNLDSDNAQPQPALLRVNPDGAFDTTFGGGDGIAPFKFGDAPSGNGANGMIVQSDGKIVVSGLDGTGDDSEFDNRPALARFNADGTLDTTFGTGGVGFAGTMNFLTDSAPPWVLTRDSAGRFVAITNGALVRWTPDGDADTTFGPNGQADLPPPFLGPSSAIAVEADGQVLYASSSTIFRVTDEPRPNLALGSNGAIIITGDTGSADNTITIAQSGSNVAVTRNGVTTNFPAADVHALDILMFDGDDAINSSIDVLSALVILGGGNNTLTLGDGDTQITAGDGADDITVGDGDAHNIDAAGGNNTIATGDGDADINTGTGNDSITTGGGNDSIQADEGDDTVSAGGGNDAVWAGSGSDSVIGGAGDDLLVAGEDLAGNEVLVTPNVLHGNDGHDTLVGTHNRDSLYGGANQDFLIGYTSSDLLNGGGGNDRIAGGGGNDRIYGGKGNDQLDGGVHNDRIFGGAGNDRLIGGRGTDTLNGEDGNDWFLTFDGEIDFADGGDGADRSILADDGDELLNITTT